MPHWRVRLTGNPIDLALLPSSLPNDFHISESNGQVFLTSQQFESCSAYEEVQSLAGRIIDAANKVALLHRIESQPGSTEAVVKLRENGTQEGSVVFV